VNVSVSRGQHRRLGRIVAAFALALVVLALFVRTVGPGRLARELAGADPRYLILGSVAAVAAVLVWSEVLRELLVVAAGDATTVRGRRFRLAFLAGEFTKQVLPMGHASGPAIMAYAVSSTLETEYEETLAVITLADLLNLVASLLLAAAGLVVIVTTGGSRAPGLRLFAASLVAATAAVTVAVVLVTARRATLVRVVRLLAGAFHGTAGRAVPRLRPSLEPTTVDRKLASYFRTFDAVAADRLRVLAAAGLAVVGWLCYAAPLYFAALALEVSVAPALALFLVPMAGLATWFPLPGGLGGVEVAVAAGLVGVAGVGVGTAAAVALCYRLCAYWVVIGVDGVGAVSVLLDGREEGEPTVPVEQ
jgi:hypothetical protein